MARYAPTSDRGSAAPRTIGGNCGPSLWELYILPRETATAHLLITRVKTPPENKQESPADSSSKANTT
eukprot:4011054-Amphidinium_carterae.1